MTVRVPSPWELKASMVAGLKVAPSQPWPMGKVGDDVAVGGGEDDHVVLVAAGGEEDVVLRVEGEAGAAAALGGEVILAGHLHGVGVDDGDGGLVFDVDVDVALAVELTACSGAPPMSMVPRMEPSLSSMTVMLGCGVGEIVEAVVARSR